MKSKKAIIITIIVICLFAISGVVYFSFTKEDQNTTLNLIDKKWIESNKNKVFDIAVINNIPIFNYKGDGIFFDFITDIEKDTGLDFNPISYNYRTDIDNEYAFKIKSNVENNDIAIYQDNYVLVSKGDRYNNLSDITNVKIGVLKSDLESVSKYINTNVSFEPYETIEELFTFIKTENVDEVRAIVVPKLVYLEQIIESDNLNIVYNISDLKEQYVLSLGSNDKLNTIVKKYFAKWLKENYDDLYKKHLNKNYFTFSGIDETSKAKFKGKNYIYGFVSNPPFDLLHNSKLMGLNSSIIKSFANVAGIELEIQKFNNINDLVKAINENKLDFVFNNYKDTEYNLDVKETLSNYDEKVVIISSINNNLNINSINSILDKELLVVGETAIHQLLVKNENRVRTFNNTNELLANISDKSIIVLDYDTYYFYSKNILKNYKIDYQFTLDNDYNYIMRDIESNKIFNNYFNFYISFINEKEFNNSSFVKLLTIKQEKSSFKGILLLSILVLILLLLIVILKKLLFRKKKKKRNISMSKTDKLRYIDVLTSLKNRNYLNDHIETWDDSEIYPQTIVVIDLNNIAYINDNYGHQEGDNVIKEASNILIKNQIENTEIIRTNGNEFLIYMVGYDEKKVVSYVRKTIKELKDLAHGFGAAAGYSMIVDAIKTIDDAVNEATLDMKNNKEESNTN